MFTNEVGIPIPVAKLMAMTYIDMIDDGQHAMFDSICEARFNQPVRDTIGPARILSVPLPCKRSTGGHRESTDQVCLLSPYYSWGHCLPQPSRT